MSLRTGGTTAAPATGATDGTRAGAAVARAATPAACSNLRRFRAEDDMTLPGSAAAAATNSRRHTFVLVNMN